MSEQAEQGHDLFVSYAEADRAWVEGYLLDALQAAGIRVHSEEAFRLGVPRLLEFERAVRDSQRVLLILSPAYLAEGFAQFTDLLAQSYGLETATWPVIPLILQPVELPARLAMLQALDATDPAERSRALERLCSELQRPVPAPPPPPASPYPGMVPFRAEDARFFFGREAEIKELRQRLRHQSLMLVAGPSGSGKSSLVFAGLVPELERRQADKWTVRALRPGSQPVEALAAALGVKPWRDEAGMKAALDAALRGMPPGQRPLLIVDQLEELFTQAPKGQQAEFIRVLQALSREGRCALVLTMRADFYGDLMTSDLWPMDGGQQLQVAPLRGAALREAIVRPAEKVGVYLEDGLVERLLADAAEEPGVLPLVQETMALLWEEMERRLIPLRAYEEMGDEVQSGLAVAMRMKADAAWASLRDEQQRDLSEEQEMAQRILLRLVQFGEGRADTRRQQAVADLRSPKDDATLFDQTLGHLSDNRLLTLSGGEGEAGRKVDLAHEALIEGWPTLHEWVGKRRAAELTRRRLESKAQEWVRLREQGGGLLDEVQLREAQDWLDSPDSEELGGASDTLLALVQASQTALEEAKREKEEAQQRELKLERQRTQEKAREARRLGWLVLGLIAVFLVAVGAAFLAVRERDRADEQARIATSRWLAAQATVHMEQEPDLALLLAAEALSQHDAFDAQNSLLRALQARPALWSTLRGHEGTAESVAWSPDGTVLASGGRDGTVRLWDAATGQALGEPLETGQGDVNSVAWRPDGVVLASAGRDGTVRLWDAATGQALAEPLRGHEGGVSSVAWSPDGVVLASAGSDGMVRLWDAETGQALGEPLHTGQRLVFSVAWSPDGALLALVSDGPVQLWDAVTGQALGEPLDRDQGAVYDVAWSPDGAVLALAGLDGTVRLWDVATGQTLGEPLWGHGSYVMSVAWSPNGAMLASASLDGTVRLWDATTGQALGEPLQTGHGDVYSVAWRPDGQALASAGEDGTVRLWDVAAEHALDKPLRGHGGYVMSVAWRPDGKALASAGEDGSVRLWDAATRQALGEPLRGHEGYVRSVAWRPDGTVLASAGDDGTVRLWNAETGQALGVPLDTDQFAVLSLAWSPDGTVLASGGLETVRLWDAATRQALGEPLRGHEGYVYSVAWRPDGAVLASAGEDGTVRLWDASTDQALGEPLQTGEDTVSSLAWSPDGAVLPSGDYTGTVRLRDADTGEALGKPLRTGQDTVHDVAWRPDGTVLASAGGYGTVRLWDTAARQALGEPLRHESGVSSVAWRPPDAAVLASAGGDGTVRLWDVSPVSWQVRACRAAGRNLAQAEWNEFVGAVVPYLCTCPNLPPGEGTGIESCPRR